MKLKPIKLLDRVRDRIRLKQYSYKTEQAYLNWTKRYILFNKKKHPKEMGAAELEKYLTYLATEQKVAASTQNLALSAILFLYKQVLKIPLETDIQFIGAIMVELISRLGYRQQSVPVDDRLLIICI
jgi:hypothetical protein